jgi:hypothetical protein
MANLLIQTGSGKVVLKTDIPVENYPPLPLGYEWQQGDTEPELLDLVLLMRLKDNPAVYYNYGHLAPQASTTKDPEIWEEVWTTPGQIPSGKPLDDFLAELLEIKSLFMATVKTNSEALAFKAMAWSSVEQTAALNIHMRINALLNLKMPPSYIANTILGLPNTIGSNSLKEEKDAIIESYRQLSSKASPLSQGLAPYVQEIWV